MDIKYVTKKTYNFTIISLMLFMLLYTITAVCGILQYGKSTENKIYRAIEKNPAAAVYKSDTDNEATERIESRENQNENSESLNSPKSSSTELMFSNKPMYYIAPSDEIIGIYDGDGKSLVSSINIKISSLPKLDAEYITNGISIYSECELQNFICDFTS